MSEQNNDRTVFDPRGYRMFSILPPSDEDEAYCVRHEVKMSEVPADIEQAGAVYTTADGFTIFTCMGCHKELENDDDHPDPKAIFNEYFHRAFDMWDEGESHGDWFEYLCEAEDYEEG